MKKIYVFLIFLGCALSIGCSNERQINGRSQKSAAHSVKIMKNYPPKNQKLEFEIAYWQVRNSIQDKEEFLDTIDGLTAPEMIALGQTVFSEMHAAGNPDYNKYRNWEEMIKHAQQERSEQDFFFCPLSGAGIFFSC